MSSWNSNPICSKKVCITFPFQTNPVDSVEHNPACPATTSLTRPPGQTATITRWWPSRLEIFISRINWNAFSSLGNIFLWNDSFSYDSIINSNVICDIQCPWYDAGLTPPGALHNFWWLSFFSSVPVAPSPVQPTQRRQVISSIRIFSFGSRGWSLVWL